MESIQFGDGLKERSSCRAVGALVGGQACSRRVDEGLALKATQQALEKCLANVAVSLEDMLGG